MADIRIKDLTQITPVQFAEDHNFGVDNTSGTRRITVKDLRTGLATHSVTAAAGDEVVFDYAATVNKAAGNYVGLRVDVTETSAPGTDNRLLDLQVGGVSQAYVHADGTFHAGYGNETDPSLAFVGEENTGVFRADAGAVGITAAGTEVFRMTASYLQITVTGGGTPSGPALIWGGDVDTGIYKPGPDQLGIAAGGEEIAFFQYVDGATGDEDAITLTATVNKATSGSYNALVVNAVETAAPGTDNRLLDLQVGGVSQMFVRPDGSVRAGDGTETVPGLAFASEVGTGLHLEAADRVALTIQTTNSLVFRAAQQCADGTVGDATAPPWTFESDRDTGMLRSGANILGFTAGAVTVFSLRHLIDAATTVFNVVPDINQTAGHTTGFDVLRLDTTETSNLGTGEKNFISLQPDGAQVARWAYDGKIYLPSGTAADPSIAFASTADDGLYRPAAGRIGVATEGAERLTIQGLLDEATGNEQSIVFTPTVNKATSGDYTALRINVVETAAPGTDNRLLDLQVGGTSQAYFLSNGHLVVATDGSATDPAVRFGSSGVTGFYSDASSRLSVTINSSERFRFVSAQLLSDDNGSASATTYSWIGDDNTGMFRSAADVLGFAAGGVDLLLSTTALYAETNDSLDLGTTSLKFDTVHASQTNFGDVHLARDGNHYTIVEGRDGLYLHNRNTGQAFRFVLEEVDANDAPRPLPHPELKVAA